MVSMQNTFSALAVPARLRIVEMLAEQGRLTASAISSSFSISSAAISQHLGVLLEAGLVCVEKVGKKRIYRINPQTLSDIELWATNTQKVWEKRLDSLDNYLQSTQ